MMSMRMHRICVWRAGSRMSMSGWSAKALSHKLTAPKCLLVDGNNLMYEMYDARCEMSWQGKPTGTAMRFLKCVYDVVRAKQPQRLGIFFDTPQKTERHLSNPNYKQSASRKRMPEALRAQFEVTILLLRALGLKVIQKKGIEADDFIASYTKKCTNDGYDVVIISNDSDMHQLVQSPTIRNDVKAHVVVYKPTRGVYVAEKQVRKYLHGGSPAFHSEIRALCGHHWGKTSGIPGGLSIKAALALLNEYGSLPRLLRNLNKMEDKALAERLMNAISAVELSYRMSKLQDNLPLPVAPSAFDILLPLQLNPDVLHSFLGPAGMAKVFEEPKNKNGKFNKKAHVLLPTEDVSEEVEQELDKWFEAFSNGKEYK